ncbi:hypothetical protein MBLNU459_g4073t1 [Dothideomycetes sp. NU459]
MSSHSSSWLSRALPLPLPRYSRSKSPSLQESRNPRWSSPVAASAIPPPIVSSVYANPTPQSPNAATTATNDDLLFFRRKQRQLEADLQILLDAQADGLLAGLDPVSAEDDGASTGSTTPTAQSLNLRTRSSTPMQKSAKLSLRDARKGLYTTIRKLALLKAQESDHLLPDVEECTAIVEQLGAWEKKRQGLKARTSQIEAGTDYQRATELRRQADDMQNDINEAEARLAQLKTQQRRLRREAQEVDNTVQAKLSSYDSSLAMLEKNIKGFLEDAALDREPATQGHTHSREPDPFWRLPRGKRTLDMAQTAFTNERDMLLSKQQAVETEREALEDGAIVWKDVVKEVSEFERRLREDMARLGNGSTANPGRRAKQPGMEHDDDADQSSGNMGELLAHLDGTTMQLESKYKLAESRNWKLLVAAIGAELEAFLKGKQILESALTATAEDAETDPTKEPEGHKSDLAHGSSSKADGQAIHDLDQAFDDGARGRAVSDTDTEDDGPDPELLISHHDTDTE